MGWFFAAKEDQNRESALGWLNTDGWGFMCDISKYGTGGVMN
jgi:hypothetical protein